ncbi:periodic tryptophan protein 1 homolog [Homarus americanus]|uniref:periodic tryptophan protein 1 homolog n=1 Tax=Homarus americanus TaxID=6706 RepID=UPI001C46965C|nr:periodic tryptophan protein 1 homolog [Homarus americanus]
MEDGEGKERVSFITCAAWVPRGAAKANPEKVEISKEELARIIQETKGKVEELEEVEEDESEDIEEEAAEEDGTVKGKKLVESKEASATEEGKEKSVKKKKKKGKEVKEEEEEETGDFESRYKFTAYEDENDDKMNQLLQIGLLTVHSDNDSDPFITIKDKDDHDSEDGDDEILPTDNLIAVGHVENDAAILEVYVYNGEGSSFYVHHDILLPAVPLCMEWLNYDPGDEQLKPANMMAIGSMSPVIEVWDLDLVDCLEPAYTLGKKGKKKKKIAGAGHKEPVLSLAWNRHAEHILASGSVDETVILWDLQQGTVAQQLTSFEEKVQSISWHHNEAHTLLTGACDGKARIFDCRSSDTCKTWKLDGEVECVIWETVTDKQYSCVVSTDQGTLFGIDARQEKPLWTLNAHNKACTGIRMSPQCPGCLVTVSYDGSVKLWDIADGKPSFIEEHCPTLGHLQCLASCPDTPFVFCMGGDNKENNFKVWDIRESVNARSRFCPRVGLPVDDDDDDDVKMEAEESVEDSSKIQVINQALPAASASSPVVAACQHTKTNSKLKFGKKKGGHLEKRKKKW